MRFVVFPPLQSKILGTPIIEIFLTFTFIGDTTGLATESRLPEYTVNKKIAIYFALKRFKNTFSVRLGIIANKPSVREIKNVLRVTKSKFRAVKASEFSCFVIQEY